MCVSAYVCVCVCVCALCESVNAFFSVCVCVVSRACRVFPRVRMRMRKWAEGEKEKTSG